MSIGRSKISELYTCSFLPEVSLALFLMPETHGQTSNMPSPLPVCSVPPKCVIESTTKVKILDKQDLVFTRNDYLAKLYAGCQHTINDCLNILLFGMSSNLCC